jgi:hypothetical protein
MKRRHIQWEDHNVQAQGSSGQREEPEDSENETSHVQRRFSESMWWQRGGKNGFEK